MTILVFFFLAYFTLYNRLQFHPSHQNWFKWILLNGWVILHCVYVPQLSYPFICWWTFSCFFYDPADVGNLISGFSAFSKASLNIWKFTVHVLLKSGLEHFEHYFTSVWDERNCAVVWAFFSISFLWDWNENWPFPVLWALLSFPNLVAYWVQHFHSILLGFEIAQLEFHYLHYLWSW